MILSSLQAQCAILSGFSPSNCTEKSKQKTGLPDLPVKGPTKIAKRLWRLALLIFPTVRNEEVVGSNPISSTKSQKCLRPCGSPKLPSLPRRLFPSNLPRDSGN